MPLIWIGFVAFILALLALDLGVFHRRSHVVAIREALGWSAAWIVLAIGFGLFIYFGYENHWLGLGLTPDSVERTAEFPGGMVNDGSAAVVKYFTGYFVEKSLSVDNIFVIAVLFGFFRVPAIYQHRVLFWGILGALAMRGVMILIGAQLIAHFSWVLYVFGGFLILTAAKMLLMKIEDRPPGENFAIKLARRCFRLTENFHGPHFIVRAGTRQSREAEVPTRRVSDGAPVDGDAAVAPGTWMLTPLALALIVVETTDLIFAVDSIPAVFAITADPFLVFTSNAFAILGLRSLFFVLSGAIETFRYLKQSLAVVLIVVGGKMLAHSWLHAVVGPNINLYLLLAVFLILAVGIVASAVVKRRRIEPAPFHPIVPSVRT